MSDFDFSLPLATLLRTGTAKAHEGAENSQGASWLTRGELDKEEYARFLMMLWHVYDTLERALERHASHPTLQPTYNPTLLARAPSLASDISFLLQVPESSWKSHPIHKSLLSPIPKPLSDYTRRLQELSDSADPSALLAHAYVRYLGDLSGGQVIRRRVVKAYGLDSEHGSGVLFFDFKELGGSKSGTVGDMKKVKDWYREGMNAGAGDNTELKANVLQEANKAFDYNNGILSLLRTPTSKTNELMTPVPILGDSIDDSSGSEAPAVEIRGGLEERSYSLATVVSFILAVCLAHFMLVVGGYTGSKGYLKLEAFEQWVTEHFQSASE